MFSQRRNVIDIGYSHPQFIHPIITESFTSKSNIFTPTRLLPPPPPPPRTHTSTHTAGCPEAVSSLVEGSASHLPLLVDSVGGRAGPGGEDTAVQGEEAEEAMRPVPT